MNIYINDYYYYKVMHLVGYNNSYISINKLKYVSILL